MASGPLQQCLSFIAAQAIEKRTLLEPSRTKRFIAAQAIEKICSINVADHACVHRRTGD